MTQSQKLKWITWSLYVFLSEAIVLLLIWIWNDYLAKFMTLLIVAISVGVLFVSLIAELLERSRISKFYFIAMGITVLTPIIIALIVLGFGGAKWTFDEPLIR